MKPPPFEYFAPARLDEAVSLLAGQDNAKLLAGGQSLVPMLNMRFVLPDRVVDLNRVEDLAFIREEGEEVVIGGMTRQRALEHSALLRARLPVFAKALAHVGHIQTRNRGTIGGSLCQLDPSAELPALAAAHDAVIEVEGPSGRRRLNWAAFPAFYMTPSIEPDEIVAAIRMTPWKGRCGTGFAEFARRHGDFAIAGAVVLLTADASGTLTSASLTALGIAQAPVRIAEAEAMLAGRRPEPGLIRDAAEHCRAHASLEDSYASAEYRGAVAVATMRRALDEAAAEIARPEAAS